MIIRVQGLHVTELAGKDDVLAERWRLVDHMIEFACGLSSANLQECQVKGRCFILDGQRGGGWQRSSKNAG